MPLLTLQVRPDRDHLAAPISVTPAQATREPVGYDSGRWGGQIDVGLTAILHQGKGTGRRAIAECFTQTRALGFGRLAFSVVGAENSNMVFHERLGFRQTRAFINAERKIKLEV